MAKETPNNKHSIFEERNENLMKQANVWRHNPHRFITEYLGLPLFFFQKVLLYMMNKSPVFVFIASRGLGKSFLIAYYAVFRCILYPNTEVVLASGIKNQASLIITSKILTMYQKSEALRFEIGSEKNLGLSVNNTYVKFANGSKITTSASRDTSRGARANVLIADEYRLIKHEIYNDVLMPMANVPRVPDFKVNFPEKYEDYQEQNIQILMSSAYYKSDWSWDKFQNVISDMMMLDDDEERYKGLGVSLPYQLARVHGYLEEETLRQFISDPRNDDLKFKMEYEAQFVGGDSNSYFKFEDLNSRRVLSKAFIPPTDLEYITNKKLSKPKKLTNMPLQSGEIRMVVCDVALVGGKDNDATVFSAIRMIPQKDGSYRKDLVYLESVQDGITANEVALKLKRLYYDFESTYAVLDVNGQGISVYHECVDILYDKERDMEYPAWTSINDEKLRQQHGGHGLLPVLYTVKATSNQQLNSDAAIQTRESIRNGSLRLLQSDIEVSEDMAQKNGGQWVNMDAHEKNRQLAPYLETTALVNEMISLVYEITSGGLIKVSEVGNKRKDRYTTLSYGILKAHEIELENKKKNSSSGFNPEMFKFRWKR